MANDTRLPIVVGVDGSEHSDRAVRYAVVEARRRGCGLLLVHAIHETAPMAAMLPLYSIEAFTDVARRLVEDAERLALDVDPDVDVSTSVKAGSRTGVLVEAAENASLVVLGHRSRTFAGRIVTSSTTTGTAARAHCPVVSVPDTWVPGEERGRIVVGVDESDASHDALDVAFREARLREARLIALHAWRLPAAYDDVSFSQVSVDDWMAAARDLMEKTLEPFREVYPDVEVEIVLRHEFIGPALVAATETADLMVVGRRGHGAPLGVYLGSLARMLIREGRCPVEIAPQHGRHVPKVEDRLLSEEEALPQG